MRILDFHLNLREMKHSSLLVSFSEKTDVSLDVEKSLKTIYDLLMEITKAGASLMIITHRGSSLSLLARMEADPGKFQFLQVHKSLKKTTILNQIIDIHLFSLEKQDPHNGWQWVSQLIMT